MMKNDSTPALPKMPKNAFWRGSISTPPQKFCNLNFGGGWEGVLSPNNSTHPILKDAFWRGSLSACNFSSIFSFFENGGDARGGKKY
jgi:hypothetical protein